jgi:hypothetical protein
MSAEDKDAMGIINKIKEKRDKQVTKMFEEADSFLSVPLICIKYNYPFERFHCETEDGYILQIFRISGGKGSRPDDIYKNNNKRPAVIF